MCSTCGRKNTGGKGKSSKKVYYKEVEELEPPCQFCGGKHRKHEMDPYVDPFPQIPQYPKEGIYGMYPLPTTCKRAITNHLLKFQKELRLQAEMTKMRVKMMEHKGSEAEESGPESRVASQLNQLDADIQQLKRELVIQSLRHKYGSG